MDLFQLVCWVRPLSGSQFRLQLESHCTTLGLEDMRQSVQLLKFLTLFGHYRTRKALVIRVKLLRAFEALH